MQFNYIDSYPVYANGQLEPIKTVVMLSISSNEGHSGSINIHLQGNHKDKTPEELLKLADDEFFSKKYATRAAEERYAELDKRVDSNTTMLKFITNLLNNLIEPEVEEDEEDDRESDEHSEENEGGTEND